VVVVVVVVGCVVVVVVVDSVVVVVDSVVVVVDSVVVVVDSVVVVVDSVVVVVGCVVVVVVPGPPGGATQPASTISVAAARRPQTAMCRRAETPIALSFAPSTLSTSAIEPPPDTSHGIRARTERQSIGQMPY
jgi:hypothetical protein